MTQLILANEGVFPIIKDKKGNTLANLPATGLSIAGTIQGEGKLAGTASLFIRFASCNLRCIWQLPNGKPCRCDTPYASFNPVNNIQTKTSDVVELVKQNLGNIRHVVITGGEPLLQKSALANLVALLKKETNVHITLESNGTLFDDEVSKYIDLFSISPKLANSNPHSQKLEAMGLNPSEAMSLHAEKRVNINVLQSFLDAASNPDKDIQLKFVVSRPDEDSEIEHGFLKQLKGWKPDDILLMPLGANHEELEQTSKMVMEMAIRRGWRYAPRIHIDLFGAKIGV